MLGPSGSATLLGVLGLGCVVTWPLLRSHGGALAVHAPRKAAGRTGPTATSRSRRRGPARPRRRSTRPRQSHRPQPCVDQVRARRRRSVTRSTWRGPLRRAGVEASARCARAVRSDGRRCCRSKGSLFAALNVRCLLADNVKQAISIASTLADSVSRWPHPLSANSSRKPLCLRAKAATIASAYS